MKLYLILLSILTNDSSMTRFNSIEEFNYYIDNNFNKIVEINALSADSAKYYYKYNVKEVLFFDFSMNSGYVSEVKSAIDSFALKGVDLRGVLASQLYGIEYSRRNYLDYMMQNEFYNVLENPNIEYELFKNLLGVKDLSLNALMSDSMLEGISAELNAMSKEQVMNYEIPLLLLFAEYSKMKYGNKIEVVDMHNVFEEDIFGLIIKLPKKQEINLSELMFKFLYPHMDWIDTDNEEDLLINLKNIKELIDFYNSKKVFRM